RRFTCVSITGGWPAHGAHWLRDAPPPPSFGRSPSPDSRGRISEPATVEATDPPLPRSGGGGGPCEAWWRGQPRSIVSDDDHRLCLQIGGREGLDPARPGARPLGD